MTQLTHWLPDWLKTANTKATRWNTRLVLPVAFVCTLTLQTPQAYAQERGDARPALRSLSKAFTHVAQDAMPAVVFIQVEKRLSGGQQPFGYNNPFDLFGEGRLHPHQSPCGG